MVSMQTMCSWAAGQFCRKRTGQSSLCCKVLASARSSRPLCSTSIGRKRAQGVLSLSVVAGQSAVPASICVSGVWNAPQFRVGVIPVRGAMPCHASIRSRGRAQACPGPQRNPKAGDKAPCRKAAATNQPTCQARL